MDQSLIFDLELIKRYDKSGPRYTSYPTAVQFHEGFGEGHYRDWAARSNQSGGPLSLYIHVPFCNTVCYYCACNKVVTKDRGRAEPFLQRLYHEMELQGRLFDRSRPVDQLHWGGGTPTFISEAQMAQMMDVTRQHFTLRDDDGGEYSIEIDPREVESTTIAHLRQLGFNRLSLGVQDFDPRVQQAVNRIQSEEETLSALESARGVGFKSISMDLIYGLPLQSVESFSTTLDKVLATGPDRLSVFNYAHLPELFKPQRRIDPQQLPSAAEKLDILSMTITRLTDAGYVFIGMDHFARPDDELAQAQRNGSLYRNFQGYATHADCDLVAMGPSAIGRVGDTYSQNLRDLDGYYQRLDAGHLPVFRGMELSRDDRLRRAVITQIICHFELDFATIENAWDLRFEDYFGPELQALEQQQRDGLIDLDARGFRIRPGGRLLVRNICMVFDRYLRDKQEQTRYSKVI